MVFIKSAKLSCAATVIACMVLIGFQASAAEPALKFETVTIDDKEPHGTLTILSAPSELKQRPVILMLGGLSADKPPPWSVDLLREGYMLVAFSFAYAPDPDPARKPQWLFFDQRFAHGYVQMGERVPNDARRVFEYLEKRGDVNMQNIGWMGSSSTGIPGLAVATQGPQLAAVVAFVSTGAYEEWINTWHTNKLWKGTTKEFWPETLELLKHDPIKHVEKMFPTAVLMVSGGEDKVVDPATARSFVKKAAPFYEKDPNRLRLVVYEGFAHNLPQDVVKLYIEHWFRLYMHPTNPPPDPSGKIASLDESVKRTQINEVDHKKILSGK